MNACESGSGADVSFFLACFKATHALTPVVPVVVAAVPAATAIAIVAVSAIATVPVYVPVAIVAAVPAICASAMQAECELTVPRLHVGVHSSERWMRVMDGGCGGRRRR